MYSSLSHLWSRNASSLGSAVAIALAVAASTAAGAQASRSRAPSFRVLQWNVSGTAWTKHAETARSILRYANPDVFVLDEVDPSLGADGVRRMLSGLRSPADTLWFVSFGQGGSYQRTVIASRDTVRGVPEFALVQFPDTGRAAAAAEIPDTVASHPTRDEGKTV